MFDHEKLEVYQLELQFVAWVTILIKEVRKSDPADTRECRDQLDRASLSALLNTAEGNAKRHRKLRAKYFDDARGSGMECAACLDALVSKQACVNARVEPGKVLLLSIVRMLTRLVQSNSDDDGMVREAGGVYVTGMDEIKLDQD